MKKHTILLFLLLLMTQLFSQDIVVLDSDSNSNEPTKLVFSTTNGKQVPLFRPMGQMNFDSDNETVILKKIQQIGSAPLSLEVKNGFYTFQLYENGPKFDVDAQGGTQEWMIKPGSKNNGMYGFGAMMTGIFSISAGTYYAMKSDTSSLLYSKDDQTTAGIIFGAALSTFITTTIMYLVTKPKATLEKSY